MFGNLFRRVSYFSLTYIVSRNVSSTTYYVVNKLYLVLVEFLPSQYLLFLRFTLISVISAISGWGGLDDDVWGGEEVGRGLAQPGAAD